MKILSKIILVIFLIINFSIHLLYTQTLEIDGITSGQEYVGEMFVINEGSLPISNTEFYEVLYDVSKINGVNIFKSSLRPSRYELDNDCYDNFEYMILKSIILNNDSSKILNYFKIDKSVDINNLVGENFISTIDTGDSNQIGEIKYSGDDIYFKIQSMEKEFREYTIVGEYYVELFNNLSLQEFLYRLINELNNRYNLLGSDEELNVKMFMPSTKVGLIPRVMLPDLIQIISSYIVLFFTCILIFYISIHGSKKISIYKINGLSNIKIWINILKRHILIYAIVSSIFLIISLFQNHFLFKFILITQIIGFITFLIFNIVSYIYIKNIRIIDCIKNRKNVKCLVIFNSIVKLGVSVYLIIIISSNVQIINEGITDIKYINNLKQYPNYGLFSSDVSDDSIYGDENPYDISIYEFYEILNKDGAIYIDASDYKENSLKMSSNNFVDVKINPNYLNEFHIYDEYGKEIVVSEDEKNWIVIVPQKYKDMEKDIINYYSDLMEDSIRFDQKRYDLDKEIDVGIEIIWSKDEQEIYSFNPEVFPKHNNMIKDPIIRVITENNRSIFQMRNMMRNSSSSTLIKLIDGDVNKTYENYSNDLNRLKLNDEHWQIYTISHKKLKLIFKKIELLFRENIPKLIVNIISFIIVSIQSIMIFFTKNRKEIVVRRLFGHTQVSVYKKFYLGLLGVWMIQIPVSIMYGYIFLKNRINTNVINYIISCSIILIVIDFVFTNFMVNRVENRNKLSVIKGE